MPVEMGLFRCRSELGFIEGLLGPPTKFTTRRRRGVASHRQSQSGHQEEPDRRALGWPARDRDRGRAPRPHPVPAAPLPGQGRPPGQTAVEAVASIPHIRRIGEEQLDQAASLCPPPATLLSSARSPGCSNAGRSSSATTSRQATPSAPSSSPAPLWCHRLHQAREVQTL
jgi:hypothetical protein